MGGFVFIYCLSMQSPHGCQLEARWHDNSLATVLCPLEARWHDNSFATVSCPLEARWHDNSLATVSCLLEARWHDNSLVLCHASVLLAGIHKFFSAIDIRRGIQSK